MMTFDLRKQPHTLQELLHTAREEAILIVTDEGETYILEAADAFDDEVAHLRGSASFRAFLAERRAAPERRSLDAVEQRLKPLPSLPEDA